MNAMRAVLTGHNRGLGEAVAAELLDRGIAVLALARRSNPALAARHGERL
ncbi:short chain dehydrogenase, partial [Thauera aminoaromatica S2]